MKAALALLLVELAIIAAAYCVLPPRIVEVVITPTPTAIPTVDDANNCYLNYYSCWSYGP